MGQLCSKNYVRALMSAIPQAITPNPHTKSLNVYIQIGNKMGFQQKKNWAVLDSESYMNIN
jgi:hypothetical protein